MKVSIYNINKRILDLSVSIIGLTILAPLILSMIIAIFLFDFNSPFYRPIRVGENRKDFRMLKLRTMVVNADKIGSWTTSSKDSRITPIGRLIRKIKMDEIVQLWDVLIGNMSLVGPRPQVKEVVYSTYTKEEFGLLTVKPGITDFSSIVFYDSNEILKNSKNPYLEYNQTIRPWKSRLGLFYIKNKSLLLDIKLIFITIVSIFNKEKSLKLVHQILLKLDAPPRLKEIVKRETPLYPYPPPGLQEIVLSTE